MNYKRFYQKSGSVWTHNKEFVWLDLIWSLLESEKEFANFTTNEKALIAIILGDIYSEFTSLYYDEKGYAQTDGYYESAVEIITDLLALPSNEAESLIENKFTKLHEFLVNTILSYYKSKYENDSWEYELINDLIKTTRIDESLNFDMLEAPIEFMDDTVSYDEIKCGDLFSWISRGMIFEY